MALTAASFDSLGNFGCPSDLFSFELAPIVPVAQSAIIINFFIEFALRPVKLNLIIFLVSVIFVVMVQLIWVKTKRLFVEVSAPVTRMGNVRYYWSGATA